MIRFNFFAYNWTYADEDNGETIQNVILIQANTDGITVKIKRSELSIYYYLCEEWCKLTKLQLEFVEYDKFGAEYCAKTR
jgi:hypothetical protein